MFSQQLLTFTVLKITTQARDSEHTDSMHAVFRRKSVFIERERSPIISDVATWALSYLTGENPVS